MHQLFMKRALDLALNGAGYVAPNPTVGCVIVKDGKVIGEGWHQQYGGSHAEVNAVLDVGSEADIEGSIVYVSLEPCAHFGKTPPCADMLVRLKPAEVVICNADPNPLVAGAGKRKLEAAGIKVTDNLLEAEGRVLNRRFFTFMEQQRPYVILKWAQTADGFVARKNFDSKWISNPHSRKLVHKWRSEEQAILVGYNTAMHDNPHLTTRDWSGNHPTRVVLDPQGDLPQTLNVFDGRISTFRLTTNQNLVDKDSKSIIVTDFQPATLLRALYDQKILSVLIEGGAATLNKFINAGLWDEARVFTSSQKFGEGISAPQIQALETANCNIFGDRLQYFYKQDGRNTSHPR